MNELEKLQAEVAELRQLVNQFARGDRYAFRKSLELGNPESTIGFFDTAPIRQYSDSGNDTGHFAVGGTAVKHQDEFTGADVLSTGYTINDIIDALKAYGLLTK